MQSRYWAAMTQYRFDICYLQQYFVRNVRIDRTIRIVLAIASATSIAAWAKWQNLAFWWGLIIAASQVISAISDLFPYRKRILEISNLLSEWTTLYNDIEQQWHYISTGTKTDEEINSLHYSYAKKWHKIDDKYFKDDALPRNKKIEMLATQENEQYFSNMYGRDSHE